MKIGLVLSGGSARGITHLGVIKALNEIGIRAELVSGVSAGSIVGAFYLAGYSPEDTMKLIVEHKFYTWTRMSWARAGWLTMAKIEELLSRYLPARFEDLDGALTVSATDLVHSETAWFDSGPLVKPICGSSAIPIVFNPVAYDDKLLLDGGILNNFATEPLEGGKCDKIIGVHVNHIGQDKGFGMRDVMDRVVHLAISSAVRDKKDRCHVFIEPPDMHRFSVTDLSKAKDMIEVGYAYTMSKRAELEALMA